MLRFAWLLRPLVPLIVGACQRAEERPPDPSGGPSGGGAPASAFDARLVPPRTGDRAQAALHLNQAVRQFALGHWDVALAALERALELDPAHVPALIQRGELHLLPGGTHDAARALTSFRLALLAEPKAVAARVGEILARTELADDAGARAAINALRQAAADGSLTLEEGQRGLLERCLGQLELKAGRYDAAEAAIDAALAVAPTDRTLIALKAEVLERTDRFLEADRELLRAIALRPEDGGLHFARARVLRRLGRAEDAARETRLQQLLAPFEQDVSKAFQKDFVQRIALRRELVAAYPEFRRARHLLVRELLGGGELGEAKQLLDQLVAEDPADAEAWFLLARALARRGDPTGARAAADQMLATGKRPRVVYDDLLREIETHGASGNDVPR